MWWGLANDSGGGPEERKWNQGRGRGVWENRQKEEKRAGFADYGAGFGAVGGRGAGVGSSISRGLFFFFALLLLFKLVCNAYFACICGGIFCRGGYQCSVSLERQMAASRIAFTDGWE